MSLSLISKSYNLYEWDALKTKNSRKISSAGWTPL